MTESIYIYCVKELNVSKQTMKIHNKDVEMHVESRKVTVHQLEKDLRKKCRNKKEYQKALDFFREFGVVTCDACGFFWEDMSRVLAGCWENPPEVSDIICTRCGKCCNYVFPVDGVPQEDGTLKNGYVQTNQPCEQLIKHEDGTTSCKVYQDCVGMKLPFDNLCLPRVLSDLTYDGCPYNPFIEKRIEEWQEKVKKYGIWNP